MGPAGSRLVLIEEAGEGQPRRRQLHGPDLRAEAIASLAEGWSNDWLWSLPLIVLTVLAHGFGLIEIRENVIWRLTAALGAKSSRGAYATVVAATVLLLTGLHALEGAAWAYAYVVLGALPDARTAMLYSLGAMTTYGHADIFLRPDWRLMGALEALNGMMLFGLTTAFLFSVLLSHWPPLHSGIRQDASPKAPLAGKQLTPRPRSRGEP